MQTSFFKKYLCSSGILIALAHTLLALAHPNSIEKLHRLTWGLEASTISLQKETLDNLVNFSAKFWLLFNLGILIFFLPVATLYFTLDFYIGKPSLSMYTTMCCIQYTVKEEKSIKKVPRLEL